MRGEARLRLHLADYIGETTSYDKKLMLERKDPTSWLKSVSAFANTQGGRLLFGVANDGSLVGLADAQGDAEFISETIKMQMDPVPEIDLSLHLHYAASHGAVASFAGAKKRSAKSSAKRGVESSAKSGAKSSAIRRGKAAGKKKNENIIFRAIRDNSHVSIAELQRKTRLSNGGVRKIISVLKSKGKIVRVGGTHGGYWEILK